MQCNKIDMSMIIFHEFVNDAHKNQSIRFPCDNVSINCMNLELREFNLSLLIMLSVFSEYLFVES